MKYLWHFLILSFLLSSSCKEKDDYNSFLTENPQVYNQKIRSARNSNASWTETPLLIVNQCFGPQYQTEGKQAYFLEQTETPAGLVRIIVTQEGLLDDSVYGEKRIIEFAHEANQWIIVSIKTGYKCQSNRGHGNYSGILCN